MMFLNTTQIIDALKKLEKVHPFFGTAFLVLKRAKIPVDSRKSFNLPGSLEEFFRKYYKPDLETEWYFRVFRVRKKKVEFWLEANYPSVALVYMIHHSFTGAVMYQEQSREWGWTPNYISELETKLHRGQPVPAFDLAVWLYRERRWPSDTTPEDIVQTFIEEFLISPEEQNTLFDVSPPEVSDAQSLLQPQPASWESIRTALNIPPPPDAPAERAQALAYLAMRGIGPARKLSFSPAERLNLITGDNGLGKSFLLETAWWALTGQWAGLPAYPRPEARQNEPKIEFHILGESGRVNEVSIAYNWRTQSWPAREKRQTIPGLLIFARVDGSFAVWDPIKNYWASPDDTNPDVSSRVFTNEDLWNGVDIPVNSKTKTVINGLLRDWVMWQNTPSRYPFDAFKQVLARLSPPEQSDLDVLEPGSPVRLPGDNKEIPTIKHPYGEVPIVHAAAGVQRIVTLAYLMVWAWNEHKIEAKIARRMPEHRLVILVDEIEAHLHPQWQRRILPALLEVGQALDPNLQIQFLIATHSPLVVASVEPVFDSEIDKLFHLDIEQKNLLESNAVLKEVPFVRYGLIDSWLMSDVFELRQARSLEAELAIEDAKTLQLQDQPNVQDIQEVSNRLAQYLSGHDEFWPRWKYFAEKYGVQL